jgi:hypothetical protein
LNLTVSGLPALIVQVGFIVVFSAPIWLGARLIGAQHPTLIRSALALVVGGIGTALTVSVLGPVGLLLAPIVFLLAFKWVLGTSFLGSIGLAIIALAGYAAMVHLIGAVFTTSGHGPAVGVQSI